MDPERIYIYREIMNIYYPFNIHNKNKFKYEYLLSLGVILPPGHGISAQHAQQCTVIAPERFPARRSDRDACYNRLWHR
jgi:hypothetical protein